MLDLLEAFLFLQTEPVSVETIAKKIGLPQDDVRRGLFNLAQKRNTSEFGIHLLHSAEDWQLITAPHVNTLIENHKVKQGAQQEELSRSALETLSIIAYRGPISQGGIDAIRGVNSALMLRSLLIRGLIAQHEDSLGVVDYVLSPEALTFLGVHAAEELPEFEVFSSDADISKLLGFGREDGAMSQPPLA